MMLNWLMCHSGVIPGCGLQINVAIFVNVLNYAISSDVHSLYPFLLNSLGYEPT